jgi:hypothetical protein
MVFPISERRQRIGLASDHASGPLLGLDTKVQWKRAAANIMLDLWLDRDRGASRP